MRPSIPAALTCALLAAPLVPAQEPAPAPKPEAPRSSEAKPAPKEETPAEQGQAPERPEPQELRGVLERVRVLETTGRTADDAVERLRAAGQELARTPQRVEIFQLQGQLELREVKAAVAARPLAQQAAIVRVLAVEGTAKEPASPLVRGDYAQALDELETAHEKMRTAAEIDEAMRALDAAERALMDARAALWKEREKVQTRPQPPKKEGAENEQAPSGHAPPPVRGNG